MYKKYILVSIVIITAFIFFATPFKTVNITVNSSEDFAYYPKDISIFSKARQNLTSSTQTFEFSDSYKSHIKGINNLNKKELKAIKNLFGKNYKESYMCTDTATVNTPVYHYSYLEYKPLYYNKAGTITTNYYNVFKQLKKSTTKQFDVYVPNVFEIIINTTETLPSFLTE